MPESTTLFSGSIPEKYDCYQGPVYFEPYAIDLARRIKIESPKQILEIACGTGRATFHLRKKFHRSVRLIATDINKDMLDFARAKIKDQNIQWQLADAQDLPFPENYFDVVVCQFGYMFVPDKKKAFEEAYRVLNPKGQFIFTTWDKLEFNGPSNVSRQVINAHFFKGHPPSWFYLPFSMYDHEQIRSLLQKAGFRDIKIESVRKEGETKSAMHSATGFIEGGLVYNEIMKKDPIMVEKLKQLLSKELITKYGDSPMKTPMQAVVSEARKPEGH